MSERRTVVIFLAVLMVGLIGVSNSNISAAKSVVTISVTATADPCPCGSHGGGFEALYGGKKITVDFSHNSTRANPARNPIRVIKDGQPIKAWDSLLCSSGDDKCPIAGAQITVSGRWKNKTLFDAHHISVK